MQPEHVQELHKRIAWTTDTRDQRNKQLPLVFNSAQFLMDLAQKVKLFSIDQPVGLPPAKSARHQNAVWLFTDADRGQTATRDYMLREKLSHSPDIGCIKLQHLFEVITKRGWPERPVHYSGLGNVLTICVRQLRKLSEIHIPRF